MIGCKRKLTVMRMSVAGPRVHRLRALAQPRAPAFPSFARVAVPLFRVMRRTPSQSHEPAARPVPAGAWASLFASAGAGIGANLGRVAGAGVPDHVHYHIVGWPEGGLWERCDADELPESLATTYARMRELLPPLLETP